MPYFWTTIGGKQVIISHSKYIIFHITSLLDILLLSKKYGVWEKTESFARPRDRENADFGDGVSTVWRAPFLKGGGSLEKWL